jgi:heat-inducible transcriptional repressor
MSPTLGTRAEILLKTLIERYIADGQPVGSRTLARQTGLDLSPATVRNIMADLEEMGLVHSPHTSAGRVPTDRGYRVFVDTLLKVRSIDLNEVRKLRQEFEAGQDPQHLLESASHLLSEVSRLAGLVMVPRREEHTALRQIDFVSLTDQRILVILVTQDGLVHNRIINVDRDYAASELEQAANYFNQTYAGHGLAEVRRALLQDIEATSDTLQRTMQLAMRMARQALTEESKGDDLVVSGESHLMEFPELMDVRKLRPLFDAFTTKRDLLHLLDQSLRAGGIKIFIGAEAGYEALRECSVVTAPYSIDGIVVGTLGVIGPTRMAYEQVIPIVDITAKILSAALSGSGSSRLETSGH